MCFNRFIPPCKLCIPASRIGNALSGMRTKHLQAVGFAQCFKIFRRHSVELTVTVTGCFNKTVAHFTHFSHSCAYIFFHVIAKRVKLKPDKFLFWSRGASRKCLCCRSKNPCKK